MGQTLSIIPSSQTSTFLMDHISPCFPSLGYLSPPSPSLRALPLTLFPFLPCLSITLDLAGRSLSPPTQSLPRPSLLASCTLWRSCGLHVSRSPAASPLPVEDSLEWIEVQGLREFSDHITYYIDFYNYLTLTEFIQSFIDESITKVFYCPKFNVYTAV